MVSLAVAAMSATAPYYVPSRLPRLTKAILRSAGRTQEGRALSVKHDLVLLKVHVCYFRWWGPSPLGRKLRVVRTGGQEYLKLRSLGLSDAGCRRKALEMARSVAKAGPGIVVPATAAEVACLESGSEPDESVIRAAQLEKGALSGLLVASRRPLSCALRGRWRSGAGPPT